MYDVIVCGAGNAALCTALTAHEHGVKVLVLEKSPKELRGGNTKWTLAQRFTYRGLEDILELVPDLTEAEKQGIDFGSYTEADFYADLMEVSKGKVDSRQAELVIHNSADMMKWLAGMGVKWIPTGGFSIETRLKVGGKSQMPAGRPLEFSGGGRDFINHLFEVAEKEGLRSAMRQKLSSC